VPAAEVVEVAPWLVEHTAELTIVLGDHAIQVEAGLQFGSRYVVSPVRGRCFDYLPPEMLDRVRNLEAFTGFWRWINGLAMRMGGRRRSGGRCGRRILGGVYRSGYCFNAGEWTFRIFRCGECIRGMRCMRG